MSYVNQIDWICGCMRMTEFDYRSGKERTVGRSYCRKLDCDRLIRNFERETVLVEKECVDCGVDTDYVYKH